MAVRGTKDLFGKELKLHQGIVATARKVLEAAGALELLTPVFEETQVFEKGVGASTDIVRKEMFTFQDRGGRSLTLRPEGTAAMVRAYLEHGMKVWPQPVRLWMAGPMFRAERPQKGRYRQFHQVNYEALGSESPILDAEAIVLLYECLKELGLRRLKVKLSSVGDPEDRARYNAYLRELLAPHREALSEDSKERLSLNPLRAHPLGYGVGGAFRVGHQLDQALPVPQVQEHQAPQVPAAVHPALEDHLLPHVGFP